MSVFFFTFIYFTYNIIVFCSNNNKDSILGSFITPFHLFAIGNIRFQRTSLKELVFQVGIWYFKGDSGEAHKIGSLRIGRGTRK